MKHPNLFRRHPLISAFFMLALVIVGTRWLTRDEPLDRDISLYAVIGREMLTCRPLYSDLWDHKPPGIHLLFAGATAVSEQGTPAILLVNLVCSIAALAGLMAAGRKLAGPAGAVISGSLWVLVGGDLGLQANQPNVELPMNACIAWCLALSLGSRNDRPSLPWITGGLTGLALLFKPMAGPPLALLAMVEWCDRARSRGVVDALGQVGRWVLAATIPVAAVMGWCIARAGFTIVWDTLVVFNSSYGKGNPLSNLTQLTHIGDHLPTTSLVWLALLVAAAIPGLAATPSPHRIRILAVLAGSLIGIAATGRFFPHYYQLLLPPLVLAAAAGVAGGLKRPLAGRLPAYAVLVVLALGQVASYRLSPDEWSRRKYGEVFLDERTLANELEPYLEPGDFFWAFDSLPGLYILTETVPASGVIFDYPLFPKSPLRDQLAGRVKLDLTHRRPELIVIRKKGGPRGVRPWIRANYHLIEGGLTLETHQLWRRTR